MKKQILIVFYFLMTCVGIIRLFYWVNRKKKIVLTYHNVIPDKLFDYSYHLGVSHNESVFEKQVQLIRRRFLSYDQGKQVGRCLITFDDGYKNQLEIAVRILNRHGLQGIFFISFQSVTAGRTLIIDKVMMWISYVPVGNYVLLGSSIAINDANRHLVATKIYNQLIENFELWNTIEEELNRVFSFNMLPINSNHAKLRFEPLTLDDLETLVKEGHLVASHGFCHYPLATLPPKMQQEDFSMCALLAKKHCNSMVYSYPFGTIQEVSPFTTRLCAEYGFSAAYMNIPESPEWAEVDNKYVLPRLTLPNEKNRYLLDAKLSGFELFCKKLLNTLHRRITISEVSYDAKR